MDDQKPKTPKPRHKSQTALAADVLEPFGTNPKEPEQVQPSTSQRAPNSIGASPAPQAPAEDIQDKLAKTGLLQKMNEMQAAMEKAGIDNPALMESMKALQKEVGVFQPQSQSITHKTVTQLIKAEKARDACKTQLAALDAQWEQWKEYMSNKFMEQGALYKEKRDQLMTKLQECKDKAATVKESLRSAASSLTPEEAELPSLDSELFQLPSTFQNFKPAPPIDVSDDEAEGMDMSGDPQKQKEGKTRSATAALGGDAESPTKKRKGEK